MDNLKNTINSIKFLIEIKKEDDKRIDFTIGSTYSDYLLGQYIRNMWAPKESYFVSVKALEKWIELGQDPSKIWNVFYRDKITNESDIPVPINRYKGAEKKPWNDESNNKLSPSKSFLYREVFHDDHITTIKSIKEKLYNLEAADYNNIINVLKTIRVAKLLKEEDRKIPRHKKDLAQDPNDEIIKEYYNRKDKDIILISFREWQKLNGAK